MSKLLHALALITAFASIMSMVVSLGGCKPSPTVLVQTPAGTIGGVEKGTHQVFLGIPYAKPPVGNLRWQAPQPLPPFEGVFSATRAGIRCEQFGKGTEAQRASEDCLFLNIWRPSGARPPNPESRLPVMVFIHGSAFAIGSSNDVFYDGALLAETRNVIVVSMNYRLGYLGLLALPELTQEAGHSGNYVFNDQQLALEWVHSNIRAFGGDNERIMLFGESAGAMSTCMLLASPRSAPLIHSAAIESGFCFDKIQTQEEAEVAGIRFAELAGCGDGDRLACLRNKSIADIDAALKASGVEERQFGPHPALPALPVIDGDFVNQLPRELLRNGSAAGKSIIIGTTQNEGAIFFISHSPIDEAEYRALLQSEYGDMADAVAALYPYNAYSNGLAAYADLSGDRFFTCNAKGTADALAEGGAEVYFYEFLQHPHAIVPVILHVAGFPTGTIHGSELLFLFSYDIRSNLSKENAMVTNLVQTYWVNNATHGTPNGDGVPAWPNYNADSKLYMEIDATPAMASDLKANKCALLNALPLVQL